MCCIHIFDQYFISHTTQFIIVISNLQHHTFHCLRRSLQWGAHVLFRFTSTCEALVGFFYLTAAHAWLLLPLHKELLGKRIALNLFLRDWKKKKKRKPASFHLHSQKFSKLFRLFGCCIMFALLCNEKSVQTEGIECCVHALVYVYIYKSRNILDGYMY